MSLMDGILVVDKPTEMTSHDVVALVRRELKTRRVGHTGTLDPFATGVMVLLIGQATRIAQFLDKDEKEYEATIQFGAETDTGDRTGRPAEQSGLAISELERRVATIEWNEVLASFRGDILQVPPMYSAKKVDGKKLYELARKGERVERKAVPVTIHRLELSDPELRGDSRSSVGVQVVCSAGTYIRTLAQDIGRAVGLGAHLKELRRTRAGKFDLSKAIALDELQAMNNPSLIGMNEALGHLPAFSLNDERVAKARLGLSTRTSEVFADGAVFRMVDPNSNLVAIGSYNLAEKTIQPKVVFG